MKQRIFLVASLGLLCALCITMEKSPSLSPSSSSQRNDVNAISALISLIDDQTQYANPHAVARIKDAKKELFSFSDTEVIKNFWDNRKTLDHAKELHLNAACAAAKYWTHPLVECSIQLLIQAYEIFLAIERLDSKIKKLK